MTILESKHSIGKRIHEFRITNGYTQAQFAEIIDISVNFLSEIENGKKGMSQDTIFKLCNHFDISADYILFGQKKEDSLPKNTLLELANQLSDEDLEILIEYLTALKKMRNKEL